MTGRAQVIEFGVFGLCGDLLANSILKIPLESHEHYGFAVQPSPERVRVKAPADLRNCTGKTQGHLFRVGETFLMQLHRSRPEPRLSTFERCWLSGATGLAQRTTRATYSRSAPPDQSARSARRARPLKRTALLAKPVNGINAPQRPTAWLGM